MNEENLRGYAGNPRMRDLVLSALILSQIKRTGMGMDQWGRLKFEEICQYSFSGSSGNEILCPSQSLKSQACLTAEVGPRTKSSGNQDRASSFAVRTLTSNKERPGGLAPGIVVATDHSALAQRWGPSAALKGEDLLSRAQAQRILLLLLLFRRDRMDESSFARIEGYFPFRCCGRKAFTGLSSARGRRGLAAAVTYVGARLIEQHRYQIVLYKGNWLEDKERLPARKLAPSEGAKPWVSPVIPEWNSRTRECEATQAKGKLTYLHWSKGEAMAPTIGEQGGTLLIRKIPSADPGRVFVGDVIVMKDPDDSDNYLVRRLAATEGYEMVSKDEKDEPFVLEKDQCWVLADNEKLKPKEAKDSRLFGPVPMTGIVGRVIYCLRTAVDHGPVQNSHYSMRKDSPVLEVELDVDDMVKNHKS
ncbi:hypothetical protein Golax_016671 [Gossypium laxum]|uniref:Mitochondrial inner membrane protease subunit 2 n=2 Tax=Gossypium TaxID=3633 RepID=A0A7J8YY11_9ROSI|nr:hypothetical protein [Gossypium laxum]